MRWMIGILVFVGYVFLATPAAHAEPVLGLQPLQYIETLKKGERKQAYIDVTNPSLQPATVQFTVQGFRQVDDKGTLSFYDDEKITNGILLDHQEIEIPAKKTLRLFFVVDGTKLPSGDVFAAIFAQTKSEQTTRTPSVRVGTLLILTNGSPGVRQASIETFAMPLLQVGNSLRGEVEIKNTAPANSASGFFPKVMVSMWPFGPTSSVTGPLVYAGNTRTIVIDQDSNQLGIYKVTASYGESSKEQWVILMTGVWRWVLLIGFTAIFIAILTYKLLKRRRQRRRRIKF
jgi:hypothetical protein